MAESDDVRALLTLALETPRAAQAACDARLEAAGVRLCGEVVRDG